MWYFGPLCSRCLGGARFWSTQIYQHHLKVTHYCGGGGRGERRGRRRDTGLSAVISGRSERVSVSGGTWAEERWCSRSWCAALCLLVLQPHSSSLRLPRRTGSDRLHTQRRIYTQNRVPDLHWQTSAGTGACFIWFFPSPVFITAASSTKDDVCLIEVEVTLCLWIVRLIFFF